MWPSLPQSKAHCGLLLRALSVWAEHLRGLRLHSHPGQPLVMPDNWGLLLGCDVELWGHQDTTWGRGRAGSGAALRLRASPATTGLATERHAWLVSKGWLLSEKKFQKIQLLFFVLQPLTCCVLLNSSGLSTTALQKTIPLFHYGMLQLCLLWLR